jgi:hypothetical protein
MKESFILYVLQKFGVATKLHCNPTRQQLRPLIQANMASSCASDTGFNKLAVTPASAAR